MVVGLQQPGVALMGVFIHKNLRGGVRTEVFQFFFSIMNVPLLFAHTASKTRRWIESCVAGNDDDSQTIIDTCDCMNAVAVPNPAVVVVVVYCPSLHALKDVTALLRATGRDGDAHYIRHALAPYVIRGIENKEHETRTHHR